MTTNPGAQTAAATAPPGTPRPAASAAVIRLSSRVSIGGCASWVAVFTPLVALDLILLTVWLVFLAGITLPIWYWAPRQTFDNGTSAMARSWATSRTARTATPGYGLYVDTLPKALLAAAVFLILFLLFNYVLVGTARAHATVARALRHAPEDPLREAKEVLSRPGPLTEFSPGGLIPNRP